MITLIAFIAAVVLAMVIFEVSNKGDNMTDGHDSFWMDGDCLHNKYKYSKVHVNAK